MKLAQLHPSRGRVEVDPEAPAWTAWWLACPFDVGVRTDREDLPALHGYSLRTGS
jgi:hypothetical protein